MERRKNTQVALWWKGRLIYLTEPTDDFTSLVDRLRRPKIEKRLPEGRFVLLPLDLRCFHGFFHVPTTRRAAFEINRDQSVIHDLKSHLPEVFRPL